MAASALVTVRPTLDKAIPPVALAHTQQHHFHTSADNCVEEDSNTDDLPPDHHYLRSSRPLSDHSRHLTTNPFDQFNHNNLTLTATSSILLFSSLSPLPSPRQIEQAGQFEGDIISVLSPTFNAKGVSPQIRRFSLTHFSPIGGAIHEVKEEDMADDVAVVTAPNSPPELSYSKSSKSSSSSLHSSSLDDRDDDDSANDSPHFEELSLDEFDRASIDTHVIEDSNLKPESRPTLRRPSTRNTLSHQSTMQQITRYVPPQSLHAERQPSPYRNRITTLDQPPSLSASRTMRRGFMSRSSPEVNTYFHPQRKLSDTSARQPGSVPASPLSSTALTPRASHDGSQQFPAPMVKRGSWQRKSVKQLEAEYNDDDEEVPEEAILENVPISPLPGMLRADSRTPSPRRSPLSPSYTNLHSANVPKNARRPSAPPARSPRSPNLRRPPTLQHSNTAPEAPVYLRKQRAKSWNDDLSDEARQLSIALEEYAEKMTSEKQSGAGAETPRRHSDIGKKTTTTCVVELPPLQKGNIMIDPLPVSKEKEAVLTRTRPSWLPPKSQKEEKKHLKEWQQMMARAAAAEKKRVAEEQKATEQRQGRQVGADSVWEYDILVNWDTAKHEIRTKELCWHGVAPVSRGAVWMRAIGNDLGLTATSFQAALNRARTLEERLDGLPAEEFSRSKEAAWFSAIDRDVPSAYSNLNKFAVGTPANVALSDVLKAYAMYRSDVGYVYGTHLVAALLCLNLRPADAFVALANLLNRPIPLAFLVHDQSAMTRAYDLVLDTLKCKHTKLHAHLTGAALDLSPDEYLDPLFRCLFTYNLTADEVSRLWDAYVFEGDQVLVHAAVAILGLLEAKLYGSKKEVMETIGWRNQSVWALGVESVISATKDITAN